MPNNEFPKRFEYLVEFKDGHTETVFVTWTDWKTSGPNIPEQLGERHKDVKRITSVDD